MCTKYWLTACSSLPRKKMVRWTDRSIMTLAVDLGRKVTKQVVYIFYWNLLGFLCYVIYIIRVLINKPYSRKIAYMIHAKDQIQVENIFPNVWSIINSIQIFFIIAKQCADLLTRISKYFLYLILKQNVLCIHTQLNHLNETGFLAPNMHVKLVG